MEEKKKPKAKTLQIILKLAQKKVHMISMEEFKKMYDADKDMAIVDVREADEYNYGHIERAVNVPRGLLEAEITGMIDVEIERDKSLFETYFADPSRKMVLYCSSGKRSTLAALVMKEMGFINVFVLRDGFEDWKNAGYPTKTSRVFHRSKTPAIPHGLHQE